MVPNAAAPQPKRFAVRAKRLYECADLQRLCQIDFGNADFLNWPHAGSGGDQFPLENGQYTIDAGIYVEGAIQTDGNPTTHVITCNHLSATEFQLRSASISKRMFWSQLSRDLDIRFNELPHRYRPHIRSSNNELCRCDDWCG